MLTANGSLVFTYHKPPRETPLFLLHAHTFTSPHVTCSIPLPRVASTVLFFSFPLLLNTWLTLFFLHWWLALFLYHAWLSPFHLIRDLHFSFFTGDCVIPLPRVTCSFPSPHVTYIFLSSLVTCLVPLPRVIGAFFSPIMTYVIPLPRVTYSFPSPHVT